MSGHRCWSDDCDFCQNAAENHATDHEPDYDLDAAADAYERQFEL